VALLLFITVLVIVIAPSVDLEPTVLRASQLSDLVLLLVAATAIALVLTPLLHGPLNTASLSSERGILTSGNLPLMLCSLRC
jgi:hypothetical protein